MPELSLKLTAQLGIALLVAIDQRITKAQCATIAYYMNVGYGRQQSVAEVEDLLQKLNRDAAELVSLAVKNVTGLTRDSLTLDSQATLVNDSGNQDGTWPEHRPSSRKRTAYVSSSQSAGKRRRGREAEFDDASGDDVRPAATVDSCENRQPAISVEIPSKRRKQKTRPTLEELGIFDFLSSRESSPRLPPSGRYTKMAGGLGRGETAGVHTSPDRGEAQSFNCTSTPANDQPIQGNSLVSDRRGTAEVGTWEIPSTSSEARIGTLPSSRPPMAKAAQKNGRPGDQSDHNVRGPELGPPSSPVDAGHDVSISRYRIDEERQMVFDEDNNIIFDGTNLDELDQGSQPQSSPCPTQTQPPTCSDHATTEDAAAAAQLQLEAETQHNPSSSKSRRTRPSGQPKKGSRSNPLEILSGDETEEHFSTPKGKRANKPTARKKDKQHKEWDTVSGEFVHPQHGGDSTSTQSVHTSGRPSSKTASAGQEDQPQRPTADKPKQTKIKKERDGTPGRRRLPDETKEGYKVRIKKEKKEERSARKMKRIADSTGRDPNLSSTPITSLQTTATATATDGERHSAQLERTVDSLAARPKQAQVNAALRRDKEVRSSAPAPAFMTRQLSLTESSSRCHDDSALYLPCVDSLAGNEEETQVAVEHGPTLTSLGSRQDKLLPTAQSDIRRTPETRARLRQLPSLQHDGSNSSEASAPSNPVSGIGSINLPRAEGRTFNDRMISMREGMSRQDQGQANSLPQRHTRKHAPAPSIPMSRQTVRQGAYRPILSFSQGRSHTQQQQQQQQHQRQQPPLPLPLPPRLRSAYTPRWRRPSWSRHSRSPSGESSYDLWGLFRMRTTWDDDDNTIVDSDSELEIVGVPRPSRWRSPDIARPHPK